MSLVMPGLPGKDGAPGERGEKGEQGLSGPRWQAMGLVGQGRRWPRRML